MLFDYGADYRDRCICDSRDQTEIETETTETSTSITALREITNIGKQTVGCESEIEIGTNPNTGNKTETDHDNHAFINPSDAHISTPSSESTTPNPLEPGLLLFDGQYFTYDGLAMDAPNSDSDSYTEHQKLLPGSAEPELALELDSRLLDLDDKNIINGTSSCPFSAALLASDSDAVQPSSPELTDNADSKEPQPAPDLDKNHTTQTNDQFEPPIFSLPTPRCLLHHDSSSNHWHLPQQKPFVQYELANEPLGFLPFVSDDFSFVGDEGEDSPSDCDTEEYR